MAIETDQVEETQETALADPAMRETTILLMEAGCTAQEIRAWMAAQNAEGLN